MNVDSRGIAAAMATLRERQARHEAAGQSDREGVAGQYRLGKADAFGDAVDILAEATGIDPVPELPIQRAAERLDLGR